jgi:hypothetical protein
MIMSGLVKGSALLAVLLCSATAFGQYSLSLTGASGSQGDSINSTASLDSSAGANVQGWSFGVCSDDAILDVTAAVLGSTAATTGPGGGVPGFVNVNIDPPGGGGVACGIVVDLFGVAVLPPNPNAELLVITYLIVGGSDTSINYCSTLGVPPVSTVVVVGGASIPPATSGAFIDVIPCDELVSGSGTGLLGSTVSTTISVDNCTQGPLDAAQIALTYDSSILGVGSVDNSVGAELFNVQPGGVPGEIVIGLVMDASDPLTNQIPASPSVTTLVTIHWDALATGTSALTFVDGLGNPAITNGLFAGQGSIFQPGLVNGSVTVINFNPFLRSDCNNDALVNIADGVYGLNYLFQGGPDPFCDDACDSNDDGVIDASDMIYVFNYQFLDGPAPQAPFPVADLDPTPGDGIGCNGDADDI